MVTKSFGKRNFMQSMGRPKHALNVPCFFPFYVLGGVGEMFFIFPGFPMCLQYVPSSSQLVPNMFPNFTMFFPNVLSIPSHFYPICLGKWCPPFTYIGAPKWRNYILQNRAFCFGESP
jgi:hypothetical protein